MIIGCVLTGIALATVFSNNGSTGGTDIIAASVNKYHPNVSLGNVLLAADFCIIGSCMFFPQFGTYLERAHKVMFGFCVMAMENYTLDYVMNARRQSVQFLIFTRKWQEIANAIGTEMHHGVTILDGHGWYTGQDMKVLCILARKNESTYIFRLAIDTNNGTLRDECLRVDHLDETEDIGTLILPGQNTKHLHILSCIPAMSVENGHTMMHLCANGICYLLPFPSENQELHRLSSGTFLQHRCGLLPGSG